jgi:septal ring factor EnvC (AmiA/AmiB activator)
MKKITFLFIVLLFSTQTFAQKKLRDRLRYVNGELEKIEQRIKEGQDRSLFQTYIDNFKTEKNEIQKKLGIK